MISKEQLKQIAADNPEGFTINAFTGEPVKIGIAVARKETQDSTIEDYRRVMNVAKNSGFVGGWIDKNSDGIKNDEFDGAWDGKEGRFYLDAIDIYMDRDQAIEAGKANDQIAIYDISNGEEIRLK